MYEIKVKAPISLLSLRNDKNLPKEFQLDWYIANSSVHPSDVLLILTFARDVSVIVIANGIYDLIKKHAVGKSEKMTIDRKTIMIDKGQIKKVIEEHIASSRDEK